MKKKKELSIVQEVAKRKEDRRRCSKLQAKPKYGAAKLWGDVDPLTRAEEEWVSPATPPAEKDCQLQPGEACKLLGTN